jgi:hypothetical protein
MKIASLACVIAVCSLLAASGKPSLGSGDRKFQCGTVLRNFDQQKNETQVQLRPLILEGVFQIAPGSTLSGDNSLPNDDHGVALTAIHTYAGKAPTKPQSLVIVVETENPRSEYEAESDRALSLKIDGTIIELGSAARTMERTNMGLTREDLSTSISYENFQKVVRAKKVQLILGHKDFPFTDCHLDALRKFESTLPD